MNTVEFLDNLEQRSRSNGGLPITVSGEDFHRLYCLSQGRRYAGCEQVVSWNTLRPMILQARARLVEHVTFRLNPVPWVTRANEHLYVSAMQTSHINNTLRMTAEGRMMRTHCYGLSTAQWIRIFENELIHRGELLP